MIPTTSAALFFASSPRLRPGSCAGAHTQMEVPAPILQSRSSCDTLKEKDGAMLVAAAADSNSNSSSTADTDGPPLLVTPLRFGIVQPKLYRGLYPRKLNLPFLRRLKLKTILSLTPEPLIEEIQQFCREEGIEMMHIKTSKSKKKDVSITYKEVTQAIEIIISQSHAPLYLHCLNGSQATSLVIACLRKLSFWRTSSIFSEFSYYSQVTAADHKFVEEYTAEIQLPGDPVNWIWMGLSRKGVVENHPTVKIKHAETVVVVENEESVQEVEVSYL